jgi:hypothetical protein
MDRIFGDVAFQYTVGRDTFHNGFEGHGETTRETAELWQKKARAAGLDPVPVGTRWV